MAKKVSGTTAATKGKGKGTKAAAKPVRPKTVPEFYLEDGTMRKLKAIDFPAGVVGRKAFCDYQIARWTNKRDSIKVAGVERKQKRVAKLQKELASLQSELAQMMGAPEPIEDEDEVVEVEE